jgi:hypothetical protein
VFDPKPMIHTSTAPTNMPPKRTIRRPAAAKNTKKPAAAAEEVRASSSDESGSQWHVFDDSDPAVMAAQK